MKVTVNGFIEEVEPSFRIADLIEAFDEHDAALIIEVNGRFVHPARYNERVVQAGDRIEFIHPAFGG
ncbi:MAG: sulfur carrier protein ThiS [Proteobacteria bacterium]|nr:sulfur carrier protein ThiS [Pseudomonadota bacterium]